MRAGFARLALGATPRKNRRILAALRELVEGFESRILELAGQAGPAQPGADT